MTGPRRFRSTPSASEVAEGVDVPGGANEAADGAARACGTCSCCTAPLRPRERWSFAGRETHWGYVFLVWTLTANPSGRNQIGKRWPRFVG